MRRWPLLQSPLPPVQALRKRGLSVEWPAIVPALKLMQPQGELQPVDLLAFSLDVNARLVAVLLPNLLELFGLFTAARELCNETVFPTLRSLAFYGPLVVDEPLSFVVSQLSGIRFVYFKLERQRYEAVHTIHTI